MVQTLFRGRKFKEEKYISADSIERKRILINGKCKSSIRLWHLKNTGV